MFRNLARWGSCSVAVLVAVSVTGCSFAPDRRTGGGLDESAPGHPSSRTPAGATRGDRMHARTIPGPVRLVDRDADRGEPATIGAIETSGASFPRTTPPDDAARAAAADPRFRFVLTGTHLSFADVDASVEPEAIDPIAADTGLAFGLDPSTVVAAVEDEEEEEEKDWEFRAEAAFSATGGNTRQSNLDVNLEAKREWEDSRFNAYARSEWGDAASDDDGDRERNKNRQTAGLEYRQTISDPLYWFVKEDLERDEFKNIKLRSDTFAGFGTRVFKNDDHEVNAQAGPGYSFTRRFDGEDETEYVSALLNQDWTWQINEDWELVETFEFISNLEEIDDDFRTLLTGDLRTDITDSIYLALGVEHEYDAEPAPDVKRQDFRFQVKLGVKF